MAKISNYLLSSPFIVEIIKCLCYFYNTSFLGTLKISVDFFDYLAHIEKKREKMLIFQYKSIVSLLKVGPSNMAAGLKS